MTLTLLAAGGLTAYAIAATCWDVAEQRIPNWLSGVALLTALPLAAADGGIGLRAALGGLALGGGALLLPFVLGAVGAGDVKFAAVAGAWLGPHLGLHALLLGTTVGLFVALGAAALAGRAGEAITGSARMVWLAASTLSLTALPPHERAVTPISPIPYAAPLAAGVLGAVLLDRQGWLLF
jgi:prepilin peptidase CpaA